MIHHVYDRCVDAVGASSVYVATDSGEIQNTVRGFGGNVIMTSESCLTGTDRVAEANKKLGADFIVNVQGDEPMMDPSVIDHVARALHNSPMSTAATRIKNTDDYENTNVNKVVLNQASNAIYFSRRTIPCVREHLGSPVHDQLQSFPFLKHLGIYGYQRDTLLQLVRWPVSQLEEAEKLEQLRAIDHGIPIHVSVVDYESIGVDTPEDIQRVVDCL